jgi:hypothetical protein
VEFDRKLRLVVNCYFADKGGSPTLAEMSDSAGAASLRNQARMQAASRGEVAGTLGFRQRCAITSSFRVYMWVAVSALVFGVFSISDWLKPLFLEGVSKLIIYWL